MTIKLKLIVIENLMAHLFIELVTTYLLIQLFLLSMTYVSS